LIRAITVGVSFSPGRRQFASAQTEPDFSRSIFILTKERIMQRSRLRTTSILLRMVFSLGLTLLGAGAVSAQGSSAGTAPAPCGAGWMASAVGMQGTVQSGGLTQGNTTVCGYPTAAQALTAVLDLCDTSTAGGCRQANRLKVVWGQGDGMKMRASESCESKIPLVVSTACPEAAAAQLRAAGVR